MMNEGEDAGKMEKNRVENSAKHWEQIQKWLYEGEETIYTYGLLLDMVVLTTRRIVLIDRTLFGREKGILSIPYSRIDSIGLYVKGFWNRAHVLEIRTKGKTYELEFKRGTDCQGVYRWLSCLICE
ncbi:hypothetical protein AYX07_08050 [Thermoactinomyces sp. AS95]|jgi:hypothetical protein|nr:hypothetical protein JS81_12110 [Thermoactinomyces sp. Gus2-1]KYQ87057.1 hypothetical protein AYX07_08050 [Thermoactinomyces sp. AS95]QCV55293.1 hypothetical protein FA954_06545 [Thermoactinomyces vulgaris]